LVVVTVAPEAMALIMEYDWPGNIRELEHAIERAVNQCNGSILTLDHFEWLLPKMRNGGKMAIGRSIQDAKAATEKELILNALQTSRGNKKKAAELLGIARPLLYQKMRRLGVSI
jgi:transcriptional regulator with PAS, ATPase and Fis domain